MTMHLSDTFLQYYFFITFFVFIRKPFMRFVFKIIGSVQKIRQKKELKPTADKKQSVAFMEDLIARQDRALVESEAKMEHYKKKYKEALQNQK